MATGLPRRRSPWMLVLALLVACQSAPPLGEDSPPLPPAPGAAAAESQAPPLENPPPAVRESLLPPIDVGLSAPSERYASRFDVAVNDAPARELFMSLVEGTPYNMLVHPSVEGRISLELKDVTVEDVMRAIRDVYGYPYRKTERGFAVRPVALRSRVFEVDYLNARRTGSSQTRVSSGQVSDAGGDAEASSGSSSISGSHIQTNSDADFWRELSDALTALVGAEDGRKVIVNPHTGIVVVRAMPAELEQVEQFLAATQQSLERQVILEAKILEVELSDGFQAGINWAALATEDGDSLLAGQTGGGSILGDGFSDIVGETFDLDPRTVDLMTTTAASAFGGVFTLALEADRFAAMIELLETQGEVHTLSNPRIATLNNQKAVIKVGNDEFFVTDVSTTTVTGTSTTTTPEVELTPFFSGIALDVTPQISSDGAVVLHIHPSVSEVSDQTKQITVGASAETLTLPLAFSQIRESDSVVRARSGQVVVIGGLMKNSSLEQHAATPWLSRVPLLGHLFQQQRNASRKSELVILLRPVVVKRDTWPARIGAVERRLRELGWEGPELAGDDLSGAGSWRRSP